MDPVTPSQPNKPTPPSPAGVVAPAAETPVPNTGPVSVQTAPGGSKKGMLWMIVAAFVVVAVLAGVGIYLYTQVKDNNPAFQQISESTKSTLDSASNDLVGVKVDDVSTDFSQVDKDLNNL